MIDKAEYPLTLNKLEGDAALLYADLTEADITAAARDILNQVDAFFNAFHARIRLMVSGAACPCDACQHIGDLKLKAILNKGEVAFKTVRQFQELAGLEVIWVHRLLKNTVPADEYILATEAYAAALGDLPDRRCDEHHEQYPDLGGHCGCIIPPSLLDAAKEDVAKRKGFLLMIGYSCKERKVAAQTPCVES